MSKIKVKLGVLIIGFIQHYNENTENEFFIATIFGDSGNISHLITEFNSKESALKAITDRLPETVVSFVKTV